MNGQNGTKNSLLLVGMLIIGSAVGYYAAMNNLIPGTCVQSPITLKEVSLRQAMRKLWTDHVIWTREYVRSAVDDQADAKMAAGRLMKNQEDIGEAVAGFYGNDAGDALTKLLKEHISIAVDLIAAAKKDDKAAFKTANDAWYVNAEEIATFLSGANPHWPKDVLVDMMNAHLKTTTDEVTARLTKKYDDDVKAFDAVYDHILHMADALTDGIVKQFPDKF